MDFGNRVTTDSWAKRSCCRIDNNQQKIAVVNSQLNIKNRTYLKNAGGGYPGYDCTAWAADIVSIPGSFHMRCTKPGPGSASLLSTRLTNATKARCVGDEMPTSPPLTACKIDFFVASIIVCENYIVNKIIVCYKTFNIHIVT